MTRVLVVNHDVDLADGEVDSLRRRGYDVHQCLGPIGTHCPILAGRPCDQIEWADVVVYDAFATGEPEGARDLIQGIRDAHPGVPVVLSASGMEPDWIEIEGARKVTTLVGSPVGERLAQAVEAARATVA